MKIKIAIMDHSSLSLGIKIQSERFGDMVLNKIKIAAVNLCIGGEYNYLLTGLGQIFLNDIGSVRAIQSSQWRINDNR